MKIVQINSVPTGSTGTIMMSIHRELLNRGFESYVIWGRGRKANNKNEICFNNKYDVYFHKFKSLIMGKTGFYSKKNTKKLIAILEKINPEIIHIHNIHGYYINIELLFKYIKKNNIKVVWTLHDCWPFTGHCSYFDLVNCKKWEKKCYNCPQTKKYPKSIIDDSLWNYNKKKEIFTNVNELTIVTPSEWLAKIVKKSFLKKYDVKVINNGIDTSIFNSKKGESNFKIKYNLTNKFVILGVASPWDERKGLNDFIELSKIIDNNYIIVLVGLNKNQISQLPSNIIGLERTKNINELVEIYNSSDIFVNPTYQDNYPTTNLEALACGLPVITYDTGGSPESAYCSINSQNLIIKSNNVKENAFNIFNIIKEKKFNNKLIDSKRLDKKNMTQKYIELYLYLTKNK